MQKGSSVSKQNLPFYVSPEENEKLTEFVRWKDVLMEIGTVCESNEESLGRVLVRLKGALAERDCDITGAPDLRTQESFKRAVDGLRYTMNGKQVTISAKGLPNSRRIDGCKFVITNYKLNELPHGTGKRTVEGYYYLAPCGTVDAVECETEDTTGWDKVHPVHLREGRRWHTLISRSPSRVPIRTGIVHAGWAGDETNGAQCE